MVECPQCGQPVTFITEDADLGTLACINCNAFYDTDDLICFLDT